MLHRFKVLFSGKGWLLVEARNVAGNTWELLCPNYDCFNCRCRAVNVNSALYKLADSFGQTILSIDTLNPVMV